MILQHIAFLIKSTTVLQANKLIDSNVCTTYSHIKES